MTVGVVETSEWSGTVYEAWAALVYCMFDSSPEHVVGVVVCGSWVTTVGVGGVVYSFGTSVLKIYALASGALA